MSTQYAQRDHRIGWMMGGAISILVVAGALYWFLQVNSSLFGGDGTAGVETTLPAAAPSITGEITQVLRGTTSAGQQDEGDPDSPVASGDGPAQTPVGKALIGVLVEENPAAQSGSDKAQVSIRGQTRILKQDVGVVRAGSARDLRTGLRVRAWFDGPVAESYPVQATGAVILILEAE